MKLPYDSDYFFIAESPKLLFLSLNHHRLHSSSMSLVQPSSRDQHPINNVSL